MSSKNVTIPQIDFLTKMMTMRKEKVSTNHLKKLVTFAGTSSRSIQTNLSAKKKATEPAAPRRVPNRCASLNSDLS